MVTQKICSTPGCPHIRTWRSWCDNCARTRRRARGTTTEMGLGWQHQKRRQALIERALGTPCPGIDEHTPCPNHTIMTDPKQMVADHSVARSEDPNSVADRVHCRACSDKQGGKLSQRYNQ